MAFSYRINLVFYQWKWNDLWKPDICVITNNKQWLQINRIKKYFLFCKNTFVTFWFSFLFFMFILNSAGNVFTYRCFWESFATISNNMTNVKWHEKRKAICQGSEFKLKNMIKFVKISVILLISFREYKNSYVILNLLLFNFTGIL